MSVCSLLCNFVIWHELISFHFYISLRIFFGGRPGCGLLYSIRLSGENVLTKSQLNKVGVRVSQAAGRDICYDFPQLFTYIMF